MGGPTLPSAGLQRETHAAHGTSTAILPVSTVSNPAPAASFKPLGSKREAEDVEPPYPGAALFMP